MRSSAFYRRFARQLCLFIAWGLAAAGSAHASLRWIEPTAAERSMTAEPKAPGASTILLSYDEIDDATTFDVTVHARIKILTAAGLASGTVEIPDALAYPDVFNQEFMARTIHADGSVVPFAGNLRSAATVSRGGSSLRVIAFPDVQPGSILEYAYHIENRLAYNSDYLFGALSGHHFAPVWEVQQRFFTGSAHFLLKAPEGMDIEDVRWVAHLPEGAAIKRVRDRFELTVADVPARSSEEYMPPSSSSFSSVRFFYYHGPRDKYWGRSGDEVDSFWHDFYAPRKALVAAVQGLVLPADNDEQKLRKLYLAVQGFENTDLTRLRTEREDKAQGLHEAKNSEDVWNRRRGSSEELALLFVGLARAAGYPAYPMAVASRDHAVFDQNVLSWSQMDAIVAIVTVNGRDLFFDPGTRLCTFAHLAPWHSNVIGISTEAKVIKIRSTPAEAFASDRTERYATLTLAPDSGVTGGIKIAWVGNAALSLRQTALREDEQAARKLVEKQVQELLPPSMQVRLVALKGLDDGEVPLIGDFTVTGTFGSQTAKRLIVPAQLFAGTGKRVLAPETRVQPLAFPDSYAVRDQVYLRMPAQFEVESLPKAVNLNLGEDTAYITGFGAQPKDAKTLILQRTFILNRIDYKAEEYGALHQYFGQVAKTDQEDVVLRVAAP